MKKLLLTIVCLVFAFSANEMLAQTRIVFLPFQNMDGNMELNVWCYKLQDSLSKSFLEKDPEGKLYKIIPSDSVEAKLAEMNLNPTSPQYQTDLWKVVESLHCELVITGNFLVKANRFLLCAYIYNVQTKIANGDYQARDLFVAPDKLMNTVPVMTRKLFPYFNQAK